MKAARLVNAGKNYEEISTTLPEIISQSNVYLVVKDLSYVVKGGRLPGWVKKVADFLHVRPVLTTKGNGSMGAAGVIKGTHNLAKKISTFALGKMDKNMAYNILIGHSNVPEDGKKLYL